MRNDAGEAALRDGSRTMRALLIGAGRMGLTHMALFNLLTEFRTRWTIVEPSRLVRIALRNSLPRRLLESCRAHLDRGWSDFDFALITSPTSTHATAYSEVISASTKIFVEKPLAVPSPSSNTLCGYVMLHHPLHKRLKESLRPYQPVDVQIELRANTVLAPASGWRNVLANGGGVINEFGSHAFSLLVDLAGIVRVVKVDRSDIRYSVDAPDVAVLSGETAGGTTFGIKLNWSDATVRKPSYCVQVTRSDGAVFENDFYEIMSEHDRISIADYETSCGSYLRGIEFTNQARHFLDKSEFQDYLAVAVEVDRLLGELRDRSGG